MRVGRLTVAEVLQCCAEGVVPTNVDIGIAISAHQQLPNANTLLAVTLARRPAVADLQQQLDYLAGLPDMAWEGVTDWEEHRQATLDCIRRSIAWCTIAADPPSHNAIPSPLSLLAARTR